MGIQIKTKTLWLASLVVSSLLCMDMAVAAVDPTIVSNVVPTDIHEHFVQVDLTRMQQVYALVNQTNLNMAEYIPTSLAPSGDEMVVVEQVAAHWVRKQVTANLTKDTILEDGLSLSANLSSGEAGEVVHEIELQIDPASQRTGVVYHGYLDAELNYAAESEQFNVAVNWSW